MKIPIISALLAVLSFTAYGQASSPKPVGSTLGEPLAAYAGEERKLIFEDLFDQGLSQWVVESEREGGARIHDGELYIFSPGGSTVWFREKLSGAVMIEYEATMISEGGPHDRVSDLNCFWMALDPENPSDIFANTERTGRFRDYHGLRTYYVGYGANNNTTTRFRRYPGDGSRPMLPEHDLRDERYMHEPNEPVLIQIIADGERVRFLRDGEVVFDIVDEAPYTEGWFAFRTVRSHFKINHFRVYRLASEDNG